LKKVLVFFLLGVLLLTSIIAFVEATTIIMDGDVADWAGVEPIVIDPLGDGKEDDEDILSCYVTNDDSNLYFRMDVAGSIIPNTEDGGPPYYMVALDVDRDPDTGTPVGDIGAEYFVVAVYEVMERGMEYLCVIVDEYENYIAISTADFSDGMLEFTTPLSLIGYPSSIDMIFQASVIEFATDTAPDTGHVTYNVEAPTIEADGDPTDWTDIPWILEDDTEEPEVADPMEDIFRCYVTNDGEVLYLRVDVVGEITDPTYVVFIAYFDTDTNPLTGITTDFISDRPLGIGAEAAAMWGPMGPPEPGVPFQGMLWGELTAEWGVFMGAISAYPAEHTFEMAVPLSWLGNPDVVDIVFFAIVYDTDWTEPIRYVVRVPVGGEITSIDPLQIMVPYILTIIAATAGIAIILRRKSIL